MMQKVRAQHLGDHEDPLGVTDLLEHILRQQRRRRRRPLRRARRAQLPRLAREGEQELLSAIRAADPHEAVLIETAVEVPSDLLVDEAPPEPVPPLEALLPLALHLVVQRIEEAVQGCRARVPRPVQATRLCGQDDAPCLPQRGGTSPACPHIDQRARMSPHLPAWAMSSAGPDRPSTALDHALPGLGWTRDGR